MKNTTLIVEDTNGRRHELLSGVEVCDFAWFSDSRHLLYVSYDYSQPGVWPVKARRILWVVDVMTGEKYQISTPDEDLHTPVISPADRYIAALSGSGLADACMGGYDIAIVELDTEFRRLALYRLTDFVGWPPIKEIDGSVSRARAPDYPTVLKDLPLPGVWQNNTHLKVGLSWLCTSGEADGVYVLDVTTLQADRVSELR